MAADNQAAMGRRLVSAIAALFAVGGPLAVGGLLIAAGPAQAEAVAATTPAVAVAAAKGGPGMTLEDIVITGVAAVCAFVAVLVLMLRMSSRRRSGPKNPRNLYGPRMLRDRPPVATASTHARGPGGWEERAWSFGPKEDEDYGEALGYGRPPGYGPPPLWTEAPYDPPGWR